MISESADNIKTTPGCVLYVSPGGSDLTGDGSKEKPFLTPEKARDTLRGMKPLPDGGAGHDPVVTIPAESTEPQQVFVFFLRSDEHTAGGAQRSFDKTHVALLNQIKEVHATTNIVFGDSDDKTKVCGD